MNDLAKLLSICMLAAALAPDVLRADSADDQYALAAGHYARQRWQLAIDEFQSFLRDSPAHAKAELARFYQAEAHVQLALYDEARKLLLDYAARTPQGRFRRQALYRTAECSHLLGDRAEAKAGFQRFLTEFADDGLNAFVLTYLGEIALAEGDLPLAKELFERSLSQFPQGEMQDDARFGLARVLEEQADFEAAGRLYAALAAKTASPLADDAQLRLGARLYAEGDYAAALRTLEAFETTFAKSELQDRARLGRAWCFFQLDQPDKARQFFEALQSSRSIGLEARYWLGLTLRAEKNWEAAAGTLVAAATVDAQHDLTPAIVYHAGDSLRQAGDRAAALEQFDRLLQSWPDSTWADDALLGKLRLAGDAAEHGQLDLLAHEFDTRFPESPLRRDAQRALRARSLVARKRFAEAAQLVEPWFDPAAAAPADPIDRCLLAAAYQGLDRYEDALRLLAPLSTGDATEVDAEAELLRAALLVSASRYAEAIPVLDSVLAASPHGPSALRCRAELAVCLARAGQLVRARSVYEELLLKRPDSELLHSATQHLAEAVYAAGQFQWSSDLFAQLTKEGMPAAVVAKGLSGLGWSQYRAEQLAAAAETLDRLMTRFPDDPLAPEAAWLRGQILEKLNRPDAALAVYHLAIDRYAGASQLATTLLAAARLHDRLEQDREAAQLYERLAKEFPESKLIDAALYEWAWVLRDLDQPAAADKLFDRLRVEHPQSRFWEDATFRLAERAYVQQQYDACGRLLAELVAARPEQGLLRQVMFLQGQLAAAQGQWPEVARLMQQIVSGFPDDPLRPLADFWIAEADYRQGRFDAAGERLSQVAAAIDGKRDRWMAMVPLRQAQVLAQQKKWQSAQQQAEQIAVQFPDFEQQFEADYVIGRALASRGEFDSARTAYQRVLRSPFGGKTETAAMAQWMIGESHFHQKQYAAALKEYLRVEILYDYPTWQAAALLQAGKCSEALGQWKQAADFYRRLLEEFAETEFAADAAPRLKLVCERVKD